MKKMNEKTLLWGQSSLPNDEAFLNEDTRDEFDVATDFASKYFKVYENCERRARLLERQQNNRSKNTIRG